MSQLFKKRYIFRPYITKKDGSKVYAKDYGLKAFRIPVSDKKEAK